MLSQFPFHLYVFRCMYEYVYLYEYHTFPASAARRSLVAALPHPHLALCPASAPSTLLALCSAVSYRYSTLLPWSYCTVLCCRGARILLGAPTVARSVVKFRPILACSSCTCTYDLSPLVLVRVRLVASCASGCAGRVEPRWSMPHQCSFDVIDGRSVGVV